MANSRSSKLAFIAAGLLAVGGIASHAAGFVADFNSGLPAGTSIAGAAGGGVIEGGVLKLTTGANGQAGSFYVPDFNGGTVVTNYRATFKLAIGGGTCCGDGGNRGADGMSFSIGSGLPAGLSPTAEEEGNGTGLILSFDTWDNNGVDAAPAIEVKVGGNTDANIIAFQSFTTLNGVLREAGRAPSGPVLTNSLGQEVSLFTYAPAPAAPVYVDVELEVFSDNTMSLSFSNLVLWNRLPMTGYVPSSGTAFRFGARTGGANENALIDNLQIFANFSTGAVSIVSQPTNRTVTESQTASFSVVVDGTPPYSIQWLSNGVAIAGATGLSYTTPAATTNMNGTIYTVAVSNALATTAVVSDPAVLTVNMGVVAQSASTGGRPNGVVVRFSKPVALTGTYTLNNGATVNSAAYGATHSEVILSTTVLPAGASYVLTVTGETGEDTTPLIPNPTLLSFTQVGASCTDFSSLPAGASLAGTARLADDGSGTNQVLHLTDDAQTGATANYFVPAQSPSIFSALQASWRSRVGGELNVHADGYSFNWGSDLHSGTAGFTAEEGDGTGLSFTVDTWDNGSGPDNGIEIKYRGQRLAFKFIPRIDDGTGNFITRDVFVNASVSVDTAGNVTFNYDTNSISAVITNWNGIANGAVNFVARTGGESDNMWIDDFCVSNFTVGPLVFLRQPVNTAVLEGISAVFTALVEGSPPHRFQWFTNGTAVAGATNATYSAPPATAAIDGLLVSVTISNDFSSVTSTNAVLDVLRNPRILSVVNNKNNEVRVYWNRNVDLDSGTYSFSDGVFEGARAYGTNHAEIIITTDPLTRNTTYTLTIENVAEEGDPLNLQSPNPAVFTFRHGFGSVCADFETGLPAGAVLTGSAAVSGGVLHITDAVNGQSGVFFLPDQNAGYPVDRLAVSFKTQIGGGTCCGAGRWADGMSFNFASDINAATGYPGGAEEGAGTGLTLTFDTWDNNGTDSAPAIEVRYKGITVATQAMAGIREGRPASGPFINDAGGYPLSLDTSNQFVNVRFNISPTGLFEMWFKDVRIFQNVQLPNYTPFVGANLAIAARTGGANENAWIDDLCINNFAIGNVFFTQEPTNTDALEFQSATFTAAVDGTPPYYFQWYTNGVAVPGARDATFTTVPTRGSDDGMLISVSVSNQFNVVTSSNAVLNVLINPRVVAVFSQKENEVHVTYTRPVDLNAGTYEFDNGGFEQERRYGATHNEVVIITDAPLVANTTYTVTITGVHEEGAPANILLPNPTVRTFRHGYGSACFDFAALPPGATVMGSATVTGGALHITDTVNSQAGSFFLPDQNGGFPMDRLLVSFRTLIGSPTPGTRIADGLSFSVGSDFNSATAVNLDGAGNGLVITLDTWDNNTVDSAPAIEVRYKGITVATQAMAGIREGGRAPSGPFLLDAAGNPLSLDTSNQFVNVLISVSPAGKLDMYFKDIPIFQNLQLPNYTPFVGANFAFGGNTGGANENAWIDDLCINPFTLGEVTISSQPADVTINEPSRAQFTVGVNGLPPYGVQWYSNNVALAGANALSYITPLLNRTANGAQYFAIITNQFGSVTSRLATVTIVPDTIAPALLSAASDCMSNIFVRFSEALDPASAANPANYSLNSAITVTSATLLPHNLVQLSLSANPPAGNGNVLAVTNVIDRVGFNRVSNSIVVSVKAPVAPTGPDNMLVFEAEDYDVNISPAPQTPSSTWVIASNLPGANRGGYVDATPNTGAGGGDAPATFTNASQLQYCLNIPVAGRYYLWARGSTANDGANNSFHFAIDGVSPDEFTRRVGNRVQNWGLDPVNTNAFGWVNDANGTGVGSLAQINIATPGIHTFSVYMREDGIRLDTFVLTTNSAFTIGATEAGPSGVLRGPDAPVALSISRATNGNVTLTWPGTGWTLQATTRLEPNPGNTVWQDQPFQSPVVIPPGFFGTGNTNVFFRLRR